MDQSRMECVDDKSKNYVLKQDIHVYIVPFYDLKAGIVQVQTFI